MIKKISLFTVVLLTVFTVNGQVEKGKVYLAGASSLSYSSATNTPEYDGETYSDFEVKVSSFGFSPQVGFFVIDGLAVGLDLSYTSTKTKLGDGDWSDPSKRFGFAPFGKYYIGKSKFKPFGMLKMGYLLYSDSDNDADKYSGLNLGFTVGGAYFVNEFVALELGLGYDYSKLKNKADSKEVYKLGELGLRIGVAVSF